MSVRAKVRKLRLLPLLAWAAAFGWLVRQARRRFGRPPRVWHCGFPMHMTRGMVRVDRLAGFPGGSLVSHVSLNPAYAMVTAADYDIVLGNEGCRADELHLATFRHLLRHADILVAYFDLQLATVQQPENTARLLARLRRLGVRVVLVPNGLDVVYDTGKKDVADLLDRLQRDYPAWRIREESGLLSRRVHAYAGQADLVVGGDSVTARFLPREDLRFKYFPIDTAAFTPRYQTHNRVPVIVHAPNHRHIKGTDYLLQALERLRAAGVPFELRLIEKVVPAEAVRQYVEADVIADQFFLGAYGVFALEGLALGKPVLTYLDQEHLGDPVFNLPIVNATPDNLERVLAVLLAIPELRERLGRAGRASVERYQSIAALAEVWRCLYHHVWWGEPLDLSGTTHFGPERKPRSFTEDPADPDFWPVPVDDLLPKIGECIAVASRERKRPEEVSERTPVAYASGSPNNERL